MAITINENKYSKFITYDCSTDDEFIGLIHPSEISGIYVFSPYIRGEDLDGRDCGHEITLDALRLIINKIEELNNDF